MKISDLLIASHLRQDARMKLTDMSRATKIPVSTIFDRIMAYTGNGLIQKNTSLLNFEKLGYHARALVVFSTGKKNRGKLLEFLKVNDNVNSVFKINNGWDFMAEVIFSEMKEVEDFMEDLEEHVKLSNRKIFYIIEEIKKEEFLSNPKKLMLLEGMKNETK